MKKKANTIAKDDINTLNVTGRATEAGTYFKLVGIS